MKKITFLTLLTLIFLLNPQKSVLGFDVPKIPVPGLGGGGGFSGYL